MRIGYIINQYPAVSHTFIRREIQALEALGVTVVRYALRPGTNLVDVEDQTEDKLTRHILRAGAAAIFCCCIAMLFARPFAMCQVLQQAVKIGWRSDRGVLRHLIYAAEAAVLALWCRRDGIHHVHAHFGTNPAMIAMLAWRISGIQYSFTVHGPEEFDKAPLIALAEKIRHCAFVVAISSYGRSQLYRWVEPRYWKKIKVVHCGIEPSIYGGPQGVGNARRFVCVGRLDRQKGHIMLVEAAHHLVSRGQDFEVVLCGDGEMRAEIEALITHYDLRTNVQILGWVDGRRVREEISRARALVLPSFAEGLPVSIIESMALSRPVISTFVAGIPELVTNGESGWLVPASDVDALADAMQACLAADAETLARVGKIAQERALSRHNANIEAAKLASLFEIAAQKAHSERN